MRGGAQTAGDLAFTLTPGPSPACGRGEFKGDMAKPFSDLLQAGQAGIVIGYANRSIFPFRTMLKIISANLNGIRSASKKGFFNWMAKQSADFICVQELKA